MAERSGSNYYVSGESKKDKTGGNEKDARKDFPRKEKAKWKNVNDRRGETSAGEGGGWEKIERKRLIIKKENIVYL